MKETREHSQMLTVNTDMKSENATFDKCFFFFFFSKEKKESKKGLNNIIRFI